MQQAAPWYLVGGTPEQQENMDNMIYICAESLRICGILLQPYMPSKMKHLLDVLGVDPKNRMFINATQPDDDYGAPLVDLVKGAKVSLFPPPLSFL